DGRRGREHRGDLRPVGVAVHALGEELRPPVDRSVDAERHAQVLAQHPAERPGALVTPDPCPAVSHGNLEVTPLELLAPPGGGRPSSATQVFPPSSERRNVLLRPTASTVLPSPHTASRSAAVPLGTRRHVGAARSNGAARSSATARSGGGAARSRRAKSTGR